MAAKTAADTRRRNQETSMVHLRRSEVKAGDGQNLRDHIHRAEAGQTQTKRAKPRTGNTRIYRAFDLSVRRWWGVPVLRV